MYSNDDPTNKLNEMPTDLLATYGLDARGVDPSWSIDCLLDQDGVFYLDQVGIKLRINTSQIKWDVIDLKRRRLSAWNVMGVREVEKCWIVNMETFRSYYRRFLRQKICSVEESWDANTLLSKKGQFYLIDVCEKIPFTPQQIRYQVRANRNAEREYGVWKDPEKKTYLVEMEKFSRWIKKVWLSPTVN